MKIALFDLRRQYQGLREEINEAVRQVLEDGDFILGPRVKDLEELIAGLCGVKWAVGVASGTDALQLSLEACGIGEGDEVITTPFTFFATAGAICRAGARPVFADIDSRTYNIDPEKIEALITDRTKAVLPVHLFGQMADMTSILEIARRYDLEVIEDACQALGAESRGMKAGSLGKTGCFSFFPTKVLGSCGDGGMVITRDEKTAERIKSLRVHGSMDKLLYNELGCNSRLDEIQAAILLTKIKQLPQWLNKRVQLARIYTGLLQDAVVTPWVMPGNKHIFSLYVIRIPRRNKVREYLARNGVATGLYYPLPLHLQKVFKKYGYKKGDFPEAEKASEELLALPLFPELTQAEAEQIAFWVRQATEI